MIKSILISKNFLFNSLVFFCVFFYSSLVVLSMTELNLNNDNFTAILILGKVVIIFLFLILRFINFKITIFELFLVVFAIFLGASLDSYLITVSFFILTSISLSVLFIYNLNKHTSLLTWFLFAFLILVFVSYFLGFLEGRILYDGSEYAIGDKISFGFSHPNKASIFISQVLLLSLCFRQRILFILSLILYILTFFDLGGRTAFGGVLLFFILFIFRNLKLFRSILRWTIFLINIAFPILLIFFISNKSWVIFSIDLDYILSGRLSLMRELYINNEGIHMFPINISRKIVDVGIANFIIGMGWFFYLIHVWLIDSYFRKEKDITFIILAVSLLGMNFMENFVNANMIASVIIFARYLAIRKVES